MWQESLHVKSLLPGLGLNLLILKHQMLTFRFSAPNDRIYALVDNLAL